MRRYIINSFKLIVLFMLCILLFYYGLRTFHEEYEYYKRYEEPEGKTVKVFLENNPVVDYVHSFFK